ncbi:MAG: fumarylacetoacetate hydrolase family protein [Alphaproteobacteria bacterium]|nr:fumarylacetoacetate hydrolase family protein [Alphaproteobacteria bacterium]
MERELVDRAAALLLEARSEGLRIPGLPENLKPTDVESAYAIQAATLAAILEDAGGGTFVGRKIGATNVTAQEQLGLSEPFHGILMSAFVHQSPAELPADAFFMRVLEPEIAFRLGADLPASGAPYDAAAVKPAIATVMGAIEVVDSRYSSWTTVGGLQLIADNASAGHWLHGEEFENLDIIDYASQPVSLTLNAEVVQEGSTGNALGSPLNALAWLANDVARLGQGLRAGELITTGTCTVVVPAEAGDRASADFGPLGPVRVRFTRVPAPGRSSIVRGRVNSDPKF